MIKKALQALFHVRTFDLSDGVIDLMEIQGYADTSMGIQTTRTFRISPSGTRQYAGYISLRVGESEELYYLGHIGYRVEPAFRGHGYAARACRLIVPVALEHGMRSVVITCDPDNVPSRKTCEHLECTLERVVLVPEEYRPACSGSRAKCRFIYMTHEETSQPIH